MRVFWLNGVVLNIAVAEDIDHIRSAPCFQQSRNILVISDAVNHLEGRNLDEVLRVKRCDTAVADKEIIAAIGEPDTLMEPLVESAYILFIKAGLIQFPTGAALELLTACWLVVTPAIEPAFMVALQQNHVGLILDG